MLTTYHLEHDRWDACPLLTYGVERYSTWQSSQWRRNVATDKIVMRSRAVGFLEYAAAAHLSLVSRSILEGNIGLRKSASADRTHMNG